MVKNIYFLAAVLAAFCVTACTGSPATLALHPDFDLATPDGLASVSVRESLPGLDDAEFSQLVEHGMEQAMPIGAGHAPVTPPFPTRRIVWHVVPAAGGRGTSRLIVNIFAGSVPVAYQQDMMDDSAPKAVVINTIASLTTRLMAQDARLPATSIASREYLHQPPRDLS